VRRTADDAVTLSAMRFHARIGVLPHEAHVPQPVEVDVSVDVMPDRRPPHVVDYSRLYGAVASVMADAHIAYLEDAAERVASAVLALEGVRGARVAVRKPHVALPGPLAYAEVRIARPRDD